MHTLIVSMYVLSIILYPVPIVMSLKELNIGGFFPMSGPVWQGGRVVLPVVEMAIRDVNSRQDILSDYKLKLTWKDTQCNPGVATNMMYNMLYTPPAKLIFIGPACSTEAEVQSQSAATWNVTHFSYAATSPSLTDKKRFPRFFRILPSDKYYNLARIAIMRHYNWTKVATINTGTDFFSAVTDDLVKKVKGTNITIVSEEIFDLDPTLRVQNLKAKDARIIFSASYENDARRVLCAAYKVGLYGPKIVWMFPGWYVDYWWRHDIQDVDCTEEEMDIVAEGHFLTGIYFKNPKDEYGLANITGSRLEDLIKLEPNYDPSAKPYEFVISNAYDCVWGAALALQCADEHLKQHGADSKSLDEFHYNDGHIGDIVTSCFYNMTFVGVSGHIHFDRTRGGDPMKNIKIEQIRDLERVTVGTYVLENEAPWYFEWHNGGIKWRGGVAPRDSTQVTLEESTIPTYLYVIMSGTSALGICLALAFLRFNIIYRNNVYVKLSSPNINNVLLLGCMLCYSSVFMVSPSEHTIYLCKMKHITMTMGFTMAFGAMFSKTWRVYRIFCNKKLLRLKIQDYQLMAVVVGLLVYMLTILIIWEIIDPLNITTLYLDNQVFEMGNDAQVLPFLYDCTSTYYSYFLWTLCISEGFLLAFGAFLSFETRKVRIAALNDSRHIAMCLYNVVILSVLGLILGLLLNHQVALVYGITSGFIIIGVTMTQLIVFIPKIQSVFYPHTVDTFPQTLNSTPLGTLQLRKRLEPRPDLFTPKTGTSDLRNE